jgi:hypothetical protein
MKYCVSMYAFVIIASTGQLMLHCMEKEEPLPLEEFSALTISQHNAEIAVPLEPMEDGIFNDIEFGNSKVPLAKQNRLSTLQNNWFALNKNKRILIKNIVTVTLIIGSVASVVALSQIPMNNVQESNPLQYPPLTPSLNRSLFNTTTPSQNSYPSAGEVALRLSENLLIVGAALGLIGLMEYFLPQEQRPSTLRQSTNASEQESHGNHFAIQ